MTREKETSQAALRYCQHNIPSTPNMHLAISTAFEAGAEWADEHPSWENMIKMWNLATKTTIAQINGDMPCFKSEKEIIEYIKKKLKL